MPRELPENLQNRIKIKLKRFSVVLSLVWIAVESLRLSLKTLRDCMVLLNNWETWVYEVN